MPMARQWGGVCALLLVLSVAAQAPAQGATQWFDPASAPFLPVPEIDVDPNSGTTLGLIPVWVSADNQQVIRRIIAPDLIHNPYFGFGARFRVFGFPCEDTQWFIVGGGKERVEREFDAVYESGRLRESPWSMKFEAVFDRSGTPRFYGIGNHSPAFDQTDYTNQQVYVQARFGRNLSRAVQWLYLLRARSVDVTPGTLIHIASLERRFGSVLGSGVTRETLHRVALAIDTRDDATMPNRGWQLTAYAGMAARHGLLNQSLYSEAGIDARGYWPLNPALTVVGRLGLRYLPTTFRTPFWALSSLGGDSSGLDGSQPLRGFGTSRFYDRNAFSSSWELRWTAHQFNAVGTRIDLQLTPFVDAGRVFGRAGTSPLSQLHWVGGIGVRALARPTVVGYVDFGYGSEGLAVFTGLNYPI